MSKRAAASKKRSAAAEFVFIGAGDYGQHVVEDAPGYKQGVGKAKTNRKGICIMQRECKDGPLVEVGFWKGPRVGWLEYNAATHCLYAAGGDQRLHALKVAPDGALTDFSSAETLGGSAHVELAPNGKFAIVANYGAAILAVLPLGPDGSISAASDSKLHWCEPPNEAANPNRNPNRNPNHNPNPSPSLNPHPVVSRRMRMRSTVRRAPTLTRSNSLLEGTTCWHVTWALTRSGSTASTPTTVPS